MDFDGVLMDFGGFWWVLMDFDGFWWILVGFDGRWWILMGFDGFWWVLMGVGGFWWVLMDFGGFWWFLMDFGGFWWGLMGIGGLWWVQIVYLLRNWEICWFLDSASMVCVWRCRKRLSGWTVVRVVVLLRPARPQFVLTFCDKQHCCGTRQMVLAGWLILLQQNFSFQIEIIWTHYLTYLNFFFCKIQVKSDKHGPNPTQYSIALVNWPVFCSTSDMKKKSVRKNSKKIKKIVRKDVYVYVRL